MEGVKEFVFFFEYNIAFQIWFWLRQFFYHARFSSHVFFFCFIKVYGSFLVKDSSEWYHIFCLNDLRMFELISKEHFI